MAKVYRAPEDFQTDYARRPDEPVGEAIKRWQVDEAAYIERMRAAARAAHPGDKLAGESVAFPVADGYAQYLVWSSKPLSLIHLPVGDAWSAHPALLRGLRISDVKAQVKSAKALDALFAKRAG